ncbi:hypothetical protein GY31_09370 [Lysinibacillus sphaericus]|uniref:hypothetical protein n=1 Tax=Lysinibacillus TaxID=400634 RepID=UPI00084B887F|nr:hypothetical protein [Lysinibacillus sphaericus]OEC02106.1 hypothetical protein GY31_09370 [Lysinibacillus sphaericus]
MDLKLIKNILSMLTLFGAVVPILKVVVNAFTAHELDRFFKTPWKKFIETSILILMSSLLITTAMFTEMKDLDETWPSNKDESITLFIFLYFLVVTIITLAVYPLNVLIKNYCNRNYYFIKELGEKWMIEISEDRGRFYLSNGDRNKVVTTLDNLEIFREVKQTEQGKKLYGKLVKYYSLKIAIIILLILLLVSVVISFIMLIIYNHFLYFAIFAMLGYILVAIAIFLTGWNDYENCQESMNRNNQ